MVEHGYFLQMEGISKAFPGVQALEGVSLRVRKGEIHALVGENGAGKSTLMKILTGALNSDEGQIQLGGSPVEINTPADAQALGISMIHQELSLIPFLTVGQNIYLGREPQRRVALLVDWNRLYNQAQEILARLNLEIDARVGVSELNIAQQQMVEVAKALSLNADLIVMDEPTSSLTERETAVLFEVMRSFKSQGIALIFISHRLEEVFEIADQVTVLRDGKLIGTAPIAELNEGKVVRMMVGRELGELYPKADLEQREAVLEARDLTDSRELKGITLSLHRGEILGIAGLAGAGRTALAETLFGIRPATGGEIWIEDAPVRIGSPGEAIRLGLGLVPEDRKLQGLFLNMAVSANIVISVLSRITRWTFINRSNTDQIARDYVDRLEIRTPSLRQKIRNLSGGNQQKVIIARWLTLNPRVLILDEPTRGVDVGAKVEIHMLMSRLAEQGVGVLMISSDLPEVLGVSDRIIVMHEGLAVGEFSRSEATQDKIMHVATGGKANHAE